MVSGLITTSAAERLVNERVASRLHAKDSSLFAFSPEAESSARQFMGWVDLASHPVYPPDKLWMLADELVAEGITAMVYVGQGGSTQAPMTITKYNKPDDSNRVSFRTIDSVSPVRVRELLATIDPAHSVFVMASKSGTTIEPRIMMGCLREQLRDYLPEEDIVHHLIAITDPGTPLEQQAREEGWRAIIPGESTVGGRFSALSVFGLFPAAIIGVDKDIFLRSAVEAEQACSTDNADNPAITLAAFLYDHYQAGRDKFCFLTPQRGRVLGLWIEQLVAESLGKNGKGILPNIETDSLLLTTDPHDRCVVIYRTKNDLWDERMNFEMSLAYLDKAIPTLDYKIDTVYDLPKHFIMWEYAIAMCGYLMQVDPFNQPDVASTKAKVLELLSAGIPEPDFTETFVPKANMGPVEVRVSDALRNTDTGNAGACTQIATMHDALHALLSSIQPGDYFGLDVFLPFTGEYRREALESIRHDIAKAFGVPACLEVGPRYLHSTGQLQKGGPNTGVFLLLSADELRDIPVHAEASSLGELAKTQAVGDWMTLSSRGRRAVHLHLPDNTGVALRALAEAVREVVLELLEERASRQ